MSKFASRFSSILNGNGCPRPLYDSILLETDDYVVTPTAGSIVSEWLLIIPKIEKLNFYDWSRVTGKSPVKLLNEVLHFYDLNFSNVIWFEHGATRRLSATSCGVEHAHLHVIVNPDFSSDNFLYTAKRFADLNWQSISREDPYKFVNSTKSYFVAGGADQTIIALDVEKAGSQYFRKVVAMLSGNEHRWDYRNYEFLENVRQTVACYGRASEKTKTSAIL